ncbi:MAG: ChbG/HpnK family deacetylase [Acidobacteriota bacterium]
MLIINADDLGRDRAASDACFIGHERRVITSASLMVFMADSARAAELARPARLETGLHINLTQAYDGPGVPAAVRESQERVARYLRLGKWPQVVYNPLLKGAFASTFAWQLEEYRRLLGRDPDHYDGHNHMHLSMNMIVGGFIPEGSRVRRSFTFRRGEKSALNRLYRRRLDAWLIGRHTTTGAFFSLDPVGDRPRLQRIVDLARTADVELMVHPWRDDQFALLMSGPFRDLVGSVPCGAQGDLQPGQARRA